MRRSPAPVALLAATGLLAGCSGTSAALEGQDLEVVAVLTAADGAAPPEPLASGRTPDITPDTRGGFEWDASAELGLELAFEVTDVSGATVTVAMQVNEAQAGTTLSGVVSPGTPLDISTELADGRLVSWTVTLTETCSTP